MSNVEVVEVCMAGLLMRRFRSKWPPAWTDDAELLWGVTAPKDRDEWRGWEDGTGLGVWWRGCEPEMERATERVGLAESR